MLLFPWALEPAQVFYFRKLKCGNISFRNGCETMGFYVNPPADGFESLRKTGLYVDKTELIAYTNQVLGTDRKLICVSRPRRFGKTSAAKMLEAYYSKGADSGALFKGLKITSSPGFEAHLNRYDVLSLDIAWFLSNAADAREIVADIQREVIEELEESFPGCVKAGTKSLPKALSQISLKTERKFFVIIDEWDALFREAKEDTGLQKAYIQMLRGLFKGLQVSRFIVGAYMTGILPIKKYGTQSALTDFYEYTMLQPGPLADYVGFMEEEVRGLCDGNGLDFEEARRWYDGYRFGNAGHIYNPDSIIKAVQNNRIDDYWTQTESYELLRIYIDMDFAGSKTAIIDMLGGQSCKVDVGAFQNDMTSLASRDDVFTLLVHLGYLAYDTDRKEVFIPNEEVREEFVRSIKNGKRPELVKAVETSEKLLEATVRGDSGIVAQLIEEAHNRETAPDFYNNEQALRSVVIMAYLSSVDYYEKFQELSSGKGYVDILFLPRRASGKPALIVELKWNRSAKSAVAQIKAKNYVQFLEKLGIRDRILLVGVNYSTKTGKHTCVIEEYLPES